MKNKNPYRFILSGGGTGGHIYPAIAIADELKSRYPDAEFLFVGASDRMEMEKVPQAGYKIEGLWISGIQRKLTLKNLMFPIKLLMSLLRSRKIIKSFRPDVVIGTGGFASGPLLHVATSKGIPSLIQEQNSYPGITNKLLGKKVDTICVAYEGLDTFFPKEKIRLTGNPIRKDLLEIKDKHIEGKDAFTLIHSKHTLLVLGGSLGARRINELIASNLNFFEVHNVQLIWQCGKLYYDQYKHHNELKYVQVHAFLNNMDMAYAAADIIISRAGAISVSELCIVGKPTIFIPSPNVAEDHQTKNAKAVADKNAAILIREKDLELEFQNQFSQLIANEEKRKALSHNIEALALVNATNDIVDEVEKLLNKAHLPSSQSEDTNEPRDWYAELRDNEIKNYGEIRPPWIYAPKSHPASMRWRMGDGETHLSVLWKWLDEKNFGQDEKLEYVKRHNPPPRWMAWVSNFIWDIEDGYEADFDFAPYFEKLKEHGFQNVDNYESDYDDNQWE